MNTLSRTVSGVGLIALGTYLVIAAFDESLWILLYGIPSLIIGVMILFNKKEDDIEEIKKAKK